MSHAGPTPPSRTAAGTILVVALLLGAVFGSVWWTRGDDPAGRGADSAGPVEESASEDRRGRGGRGPDGRPPDRQGVDPEEGSSLGEQAEEIAGDGIPEDAQVVVVSVDGLRADWVTPDRMPVLADLFASGAGTLDARTEQEMTVTLPNHTGMVTGRRVAAGRGGHGVTWNTTSPRNVRPGVESVFGVIDDAGGSSLVLAGKPKFEMWERSWPGDVDVEILGNQDLLVGAATEVLGRHDLTFVHLSGPDTAGHAEGWGSPGYAAAVSRADAHIGRVVDAIVSDTDLADRTIVVVTADHGGVFGARDHSEADEPENYTIPFLVWGPGVTPGDLYGLNPDYADPADGRPGYGGPQPVRNADVANLVTDLLGLGPVPGSELNRDQDLTVDGSD